MAGKPRALGEARITTRYLPTRHKEMEGGSLYWIHAHVICGRSPILDLNRRRWAFLGQAEPVLIPVTPARAARIRGGAIWPPRTRRPIWAMRAAGMPCPIISSANWRNWGWFEGYMPRRVKGPVP
jgi:hypothetical protein